MPIKTLTTNEFVERAKNVHGNEYEYSKTIYGKNSHQKVVIICQKHGKFLQTPNNHLFGKGCPKCQIKYDTKSFIKKANIIHNNKYDYSKSNYINAHAKICITCPIHGNFIQRSTSHLQGVGCIECAKQIGVSNKNDFVKKSKKIHGNKYDYNNVIYKNAHTKIEITCFTHGPFKQTPNAHLSGKGCQKCTNIISKPEVEFLNNLNILNRQKRIGKFKIDGFDKKTNTIYEFLGDYYHGNPKIFNPNDYNKTCHKTFGELHQNTFKKFNKLKSLGYTIKYIWESDWKKSKNKIIIYT